MTFNYYAETDSLYINLAGRSSAKSEPVSPDIVLDFDESNDLVGIDIDHASTHIDLTNLTLDSLPLQGLSMTKAN